MNVKVFISYKWQDSVRNAWVEKFYKDLRQKGIDAKLDKYEVAPGESFSDYMTRGVKESKHVLFIITPKAVKTVESGHGALAFEMQIANARHLTARKGHFSIIPIFREGNATSTYLLDNRYLDFRNDEEYESQLEELIQWITGKIKPPALGEPSETDDIYTLDSSAEVEALLKRFGRVRILSWCYEEPGFPTTHIQKGEQGEVNGLTYTRSLESEIWDDCPENRSLMLWDLEFDKKKGIIAISRRRYVGGTIDDHGYYIGPETQENIENLLKRVGKVKITGEEGEGGAIELGDGLLLKYTPSEDYADAPWEKNYYIWVLEWREPDGIILVKRYNCSPD